MSIIEWRAIERIIATLSGILFVYLGYRLFLKLPERTDGEGKVTLPGDISIYISRVGPGGFLGLFGASILIASFCFPLAMYPAQPDGRHDPNAVPRPGFIQYLGGGGADLDMNRSNVVADIYMLNQVPAALRGERIGVELNDLEKAIARIKLALMWSVWGDGREWGNYERFRAWISDRDGQPTPPEFAAPTAVFDRRRIGSQSSEVKK
jgi:hypothetical protein